jgi:hypothetical protein
MNELSLSAADRNASCASNSLAGRPNAGLISCLRQRTANREGLTNAGQSSKRATAAITDAKRLSFGSEPNGMIEAINCRRF